MTDIQFSKYARSLIGQIVTWKGKIINISKNQFNSNYIVKISTNKTNNFNVQFDVSESQAFRLKKNVDYYFTGTIKYIIITVDSFNIENNIEINGKKTKCQTVAYEGKTIIFQNKYIIKNPTIRKNISIIIILENVNFE